MKALLITVLILSIMGIARMVFHLQGSYPRSHSTGRTEDSIGLIMQISLFVWCINVLLALP